MDNQEHLTGRYEIRLKSRGGAPLTVDATHCPGSAIRKAAAIKGEAYDSDTDRVFSKQTGTWLKVTTQAVIEGELSKHVDDQSYSDIAFAIAADLCEYSAQEATL